MIFSSVHSPHIYASDFHDPQILPYAYSSIIRVLTDLIDRGVLIVDVNRLLSSEFRTALAKWPVKYRPKIISLLEVLRARSRIITVEAPQVSPTSSLCVLAERIADEYHPDFLLGVPECPECGRGSSTSTPIVLLPDYLGPEHFDFVDIFTSLSLRGGKWDRAEFERRVWRPVFRFSKYVKLYDRNIGHSMVSRKDITKDLAADYGDEFLSLDSGFAIKANFARSLKWIVEQFSINAMAKASRFCEITTGIVVEDDSDLTQASEKAQAIRSFFDTLSQMFGVKILVRIRAEQPYFQLRHDRFLVTNQVCLSLGRGFDLLSRRDRIIGTTLSLMNYDDRWDLIDESFSTGSSL